LYKIWQKNFKDHDVKFKIIGQTSELNPNVQKTIQKIEEGTKEKNKLTVNVCFNYGGQQDILQAMQKIAQEVKEEKVNVSEIKKEMIEERLLTGNTPPIDLVIRTSGEFRISNFMLWQISYAEFYISNYNWPDFTKEEFKKAIWSYHQRERRYGGTN
jgi:undecaprenyl diphosphate synthase